MSARSTDDLGGNVSQSDKSAFGFTEAIRMYTLRRAGGRCEACTQQAPFIAKQGPYLETHHLKRLADGGPDHPNNVIAVCPNCHRRAHSSIDRNNFNNSLILIVNQKEDELRAQRD